jgi:hypothetical protein
MIPVVAGFRTLMNQVYMYCAVVGFGYLSLKRTPVQIVVADPLVARVRTLNETALGFK